MGLPWRFERGRAGAGLLFEQPLLRGALRGLDQELLQRVCLIVERGDLGLRRRLRGFDR